MSPFSRCRPSWRTLSTERISAAARLIVPAFAVGRTQQLVLLLHELIDAKTIPSFPIFVDSPLAVNVTDVFRKHPELL